MTPDPTIRARRRLLTPIQTSEIAARQLADQSYVCTGGDVFERTWISPYSGLLSEPAAIAELRAIRRDYSTPGFSLKECR